VRAKYAAEKWEKAFRANVPIELVKHPKGDKMVIQEGRDKLEKWLAALPAPAQRKAREELHEQLAALNKEQARRLHALSSARPTSN